ncbi:BQ2448_6953 [Microbotryum intermedium]|uniref:BQ2448_6953 protein n=1 Tax=Microbotryum intermedium TaxID=269621 RepID=A0A238FP93_9BASI|nr:BQ2448_6953 [Microbotryum intermedium]
MLETNPTKLRQWLLQQLEPISDADPNVLAEYVLALLKHDAPLEQLKTHCAGQLQEFLGPQTSAFISRLFFYLASAPTTGTDAALAFSSSSSAVATSESHTRGPRGCKISQPSRSDATRPEFAATLIRPEPRPAVSPPSPPSPMTSWPSTDARPLLCEAYHRYGFCPRGLMCIFLHDVRGDFSASFPAEMAHQVATGPAHQLAMPTSAAAWPLPIAIPPVAPFETKSGWRPTESVVFDHAIKPGLGRERKRRAFVPLRSTCAIRIENIPSDKVDQDGVAQYFRNFGDISFVEVDAANRRAVVTYKTPAQAELALNSPDAVLGNRFIRVHRMPPGIHCLNNRATPGSHPLPLNVWQSAPHLDAPGAGSTSSGTPCVSANRSRLQSAVSLEENVADQKRLLERIGLCSDRADKVALTKELRLVSNKGAILRAELERAEKAVKGELELARLRDEVSLSSREHSFQMFSNFFGDELPSRSQAAALGIDARLQGTLTDHKGGRGASWAQRGRGPGGGRSWNSTNVRRHRLDNRSKSLLLRSIPPGTDITTVREALERYGIVSSMEANSELAGPSYVVESESTTEAEKIMSHSSELKSEFVGLELSWR